MAGSRLLGATAPTAPRWPSASPGNGQATVHWTVPVSDGGASIQAYVITPYVAGHAQTARLFKSAATTEVVLGLTNGTSYTFGIAAQNSVGTGPQSPGTPPIIVGTPPAPTGVSSITQDGAATVSWTPPTSGSAQTYKITPFVGSVAQSPTTKTAPATWVHLTGLTNGTAYTFKVQATNAYGTGPPSVMSGMNVPRAGQIFGDEFSGSTVNPAWYRLTRDSDQSNSELQYYLPSQVTLDGAGHLVITTTNVPITAPTYSDTNYPAGGPNVTRAYRSGMVQWSLFHALYGTGKTLTVQFAGTMPAGVGSGIWPGSGWMLGANCQQTNKHDPDSILGCDWPNPGSEEIDIAEFGGSGQGNLTTYKTNFFYGSGYLLQDHGVSDAHLNQHVYQVDWSAGSLVWKLDGNVVQTYNSHVPTTPMFLMFNVAVAGNVQATFPQSMKIDYIRVFNR